jgi:AhpD family alkylhydroperoxidase
MAFAPMPGAIALDRERALEDAGQTVRFQDTLRRLAIIDEGFVTGEAGLGLGQTGITSLDPKTAALLQLAAAVANGSPAACLTWSTGAALAAGANEDEIADVLLAIAPVAGLGRVVAAAPEVATALDYDIAAALEELDDQQSSAQVNPGRWQTGERGISNG